VVTASRDDTARLWPCEICRPVDEMAAELAKTVGRELTDEERRRFGVPKALFPEGDSEKRRDSALLTW
jgi:hypothetical protein